MAQKPQNNRNDMEFNAEVFHDVRTKTNHIYERLFEGNGESLVTQISKNTDNRLRIERLTENLFIKVAGFMLINWIVIIGALYFVK